MADSGYFGLRLGEALNAGAGHIANALQRKYELQRQNELMAQQRQQQNLMTGATLAKANIEYDPDNPAAAFEQMGIVAKQGRAQQAAETALTNSRAVSGGARDNAPAGFRPTPEGNLEAIPGGPADLKAQAALNKEADSIEAQNDRYERTRAMVDKALSKLGFWSTGLGAETLSGWGGTSARSLKAALDPIKANIGFDRLTQMRNESKTGGALGNVSDRELQLLTSSAGSLDQGMKKSELEENLKQIKEILDKAKRPSVRPVSAQSAPAPTSVWTPDKESEYQQLKKELGR